MSKQKILVIGDCQVKPDEDLTFLDHIGQYIVDKRPDVLVCIGDFYDFPSLSSYDKGKRSFEGRRLLADLQAGNEGMERLLAPLKALQAQQRANRKRVYSPRMVFTLGNHEDRADRASRESPELDGLIGTHMMQLDEHGWEVYPFLKPVEIAGIYFVHYLANPMTGKPYSGNALNQLKTVGKSFCVGHKQVLDFAIRPTIDGCMQLGVVNGACLTPDHRVLHADLSYRELGDLQVGDKLVSFEESLEGRRGRRFKTGTVLAVARDVQDVYEVVLESGKVFKVTQDHRWVVKTGGRYRWAETCTLRKGTKIPKFLDEWEPLTSYTAGWLSGIYDGEGCYSVREVDHGVVGQLEVSQKPGMVQNKIAEAIQSLYGSEVTTSIAVNRSVIQTRIQGGVRKIAKLLGTLRPVRLLPKFQPEHLGRLTCDAGMLDTVVSIRLLGKQEIVQTKIDEGTMIVEGYAHHNCYPHDEDYKGFQGNNHFRGLIMLHEAADGFALPMPVSLEYLEERYG